MKILYVASECKGFVATGGLAEVAGSLPKAIMSISKSNDVRVILPLYKQIKEKYNKSLVFLGYKYITMPRENEYAGIMTLEQDGVTYYFVDNEYFFNRDGALYGHYDDGERFAFFSKAILETIDIMDFYPDIIHTNDWHTALVNIYLDIYYKKQNCLTNIKSVFTIHNIEYQGIYGLGFNTDVMDIDKKYMSIVEYNGSINLVKGAIVCADLVTTVSPNYANEIRNDYFACGLASIINENAHKLVGIVNGIDVKFYNPKTDKAIFAKFDVETFDKKAVNKSKLQEMLGLEQNPKACLVSIITRLASHKGIDLIISRFYDIMRDNVQLVILGTGDPYYEGKFCEFAGNFAGRVSACITFNNDLSKKIYAASDLFLMPSKMEPCGLSQMIASRYGAVPIVRSTGGLKDTIIDYGDDGNGFVFQDYNSYHMLDKIRQGVALYKDKEKFEELAKKCMKKDFSWKVSAKSYIENYKKIR